MGRCRRLSLGSLPVPKQLEESLGSTYLLRSVGNRRGLAVCASFILMFFPSAEGFSGCRGSSELFCSHEIRLASLHRQHEGHQVPRRMLSLISSLVARSCSK